MEPSVQPKINNRKNMKVSSLSLDKEDLRKFCDILQERANSAAEIEVREYKKNQQTNEQFEANKLTLRESFKLNITVTGIDGSSHWGGIEEVFDSVSFPDQVKSLYVDSEAVLKNVHRWYPQNAFIIFLDFSKPSVFDLSLLPSTGTPNESNVEVKGYDSTWVSGVFSEIKSFIGKRSSTLSRVHNHSVYDILLWFLGFPLSFWMCGKLSPLIEKIFENGNVFVVNAFYLYGFVVTLFVFRILFHYLRWVCPLVEYKSKNNKILAHRLLLGMLATGWLGRFIWEVVTWLGTAS